MRNYTVQEGKWEEFFNYELPELIYSRKKSHTLVHSMDYPPDKEFNLPISILEISVYNPMAYKNQKVFKAKLWFDKEGRTGQLKPGDYFKYSEYSFELRDILYEIGEEIKITTLRDRTTIIKTKEPSNYSFDIIFLYLKNKTEQNLPYIENWLSEHLKEEQVNINEYITLELKEESYRVYCKGNYFWTFIQDDIRRPKPIETEMDYEEWFKNDYLPLVDNEFKPKELEFSDVCKLFQRWNDNTLKNLDFNWHFYGHLMGSLHNAGHPEAKKIYDNEINKRDDNHFQTLVKKDEEMITQKGMWNDFFEVDIPEQELRALEHQTSSWMQFTYDPEKMVPRSILDITIFKVKNPTDRWLEIKWYLERNNEIREIEHERNTYFKYWVFLSKKEEILRNLGEEIELNSFLDGSTSISFCNPNFIPKEIIFPEFKRRMNQVFINFKNII